MADPSEEISIPAQNSSIQFPYDLDIASGYGISIAPNPADSPTGAPVNSSYLDAPVAASWLSAPITDALINPGHLTAPLSTANHTSTPPKIGARFSRDSIKILKRWLCSHIHHPYPSDNDIEILQRQTGLNRTQLKTWLTNARRRGKNHTCLHSSMSHPGSTQTKAIDIPNRPGTPAVGSSLNHQGLGPLQRWVDSPPEDEPAAAIAIARAVASSRAGPSNASDQMPVPLAVARLLPLIPMGQTMASWEGDWGFDEFVLKMVENAIPPYLIEAERNTPWPFAASITPLESPRSAYEMIALELAFFFRNYYDETETMPDNDVLHLEACRIIFASEVLSADETVNLYCSSWLRDLITSSEDIARQAQFGPIRSQAECRSSALKIIGQKNLFEACPLETQLQNFVQARLESGSTVIGDHELQEEACRIVTVVDKEQTTGPSNFITNWLVQLIWSSGHWLADFRQRTSIAPHKGPEELPTETITGLNPGLFIGLRAEEEDIEHFEPLNTVDWEFNDGGDDHSDDANAKTATGDENWMLGLEQLQWPPSEDSSPADLSLPHGSISPAQDSPSQNSNQSFSPFITPPRQPLDSPTLAMDPVELDHRPEWVKNSLSFQTDANFVRWLTRELRRWVKATMSHNNPNCHTPSDDELQHQARCILYDE
ncbi:hypothetical protein G7Z17_g7050 [Cylindrodendrum hubeiense]|uniref:Homeobox domain-containing protein n=1 Tax=Cylindrodendrum hubeiense TaxID=595255 RepID=A0A9P5H4B6_9HYPO|nr:hypothetical protein G7Z17_g7050 [Cylindrodendrum hubeiense]